MILAVDVDYKDEQAKVAGVLFEGWADSKAVNIVTTIVNDICEYETGLFYKRELPCILQLLDELDDSPDCIVVDVYVFLDGVEKPALGKYLYDALDKKSPLLVSQNVLFQIYRMITRYSEVTARKRCL